MARALAKQSGTQLENAFVFESKQRPSDMDLLREERPD